MNTRFKDIFRGKVVNKRLTVNTGVDEFPRFVVEYLIDNYCTEENFQDDLQQVIKRLRENFVHGAEAEKIRHQIRETRNHSIIANLEVRLQETEDKYWGTIGAINESFVNVTESLVRQYPMLLSGGMWGTITLTYDETEVHNKKIRPFKVTEFTPFQISVIDLNEYIEKRRQFEADEWLDILINSVGLNPDQLSRREKLLYMMRLVPMVEANCNTIELAPRETGKTYIYRNQSYYVTVLSGGKATPAGLFINNATGKVGVVGSRDAVVFDEIANTDFTDPKALVSIMQGYMQDGKFSRGKKEILAFASIVLVGNIDIQAKLPHEKYYHLFEPLPDFPPGRSIHRSPSRLCARLGDFQDPPGFARPGLWVYHRLLLRDHARASPQRCARLVQGPVSVDGYLDCQSGDHRQRCPGRREDALGPAETDVPHGELDGRPTRRASFCGH